jgi:hypothetical protein
MSAGGCFYLFLHLATAVTASKKDALWMSTLFEVIDVYNAN